MNDRLPIVHKRGSFLAYFDPRGRGAQPARPAPLDHQRVIETPRYTVTLHIGESAMLTDDPASGCVLLVSGDVCRPQATSIGPALLDLYARQGADFVNDLDGVFALLLIDPVNDRILIGTDRMNSIKLLTSREGEALIVSNSLYLHPVQGRRIDRTAVACYLAGGYIYNNRTLFEGVDMLDGATLYRLEDEQLTPHKYWRYVFTPSGESRSTDSLKKDFGDLLIEAVKRRLRPDRPIYLSLTAGYDGCALLGILERYFHVPDVTTFTYAHGSAFRADSDEALAAKIAALCGYRHQILEGFDGSATRTLELNGRLGGGMTRLCDEVDAWVRLGARVEPGSLPVMYTGDTLQLGGDWPVNSYNDIVAAAKLWDFSVLSWTKPLLGSHYDEFLAATRSEIALAVQNTPRVEDGRDFRQMVRFDQYHSRATGTWREYYTARWFEPAHPLLDNDVLNFILGLPFEHRRDRSLYKATVTSMFPKLFEIPRAATASYAAYWPEVIQRQSADLRVLIQAHSNPLDDVIDPNVLLALLTTGAPRAARSNAALTIALRRAYRLLKRVKWNRTRLGRPWLFKHLIPVDMFLTRALVLRTFLAEVTIPNP